jgi:hypothetical protein
MREVRSLLDELQRLGATVTTRGEPYSSEAVRRAEATLGFALPPEYVELLTTLGHVHVELERTWFFYGLDDGLTRTREYDATFESFRTNPRCAGNYYPRRFFVLADQGDFSNRAEGTVYDADLDAMLGTNGGRYVSRDHAFVVGYWQFLHDELSKIRRRIADEDDVLVGGSPRALAKRQRERPAAVSDELRAAVDRLYAAFAAYEKAPRWQCFFGEKCEDCKKSNAALTAKALRELSPHDLSHYAYMGLVASTQLPKTPAERERAYKHFLPRILELFGEIGATGNPFVVMPTILKAVFGEGVLTPEERAALDAWALLRFAHDIEQPSTTTNEIHAFLYALSTGTRTLAPFIEAWSRAGATAKRHAEDFEISEDAAYYGWHGSEAQFAELKEFLLR